MGIVTAVRRNVKNPSRCSVFVDDEFLAACPIDVALSLGIRKGIELTADLERQLRREDKRIVMRQKAYRFATYKPRTEHQVRAFLATKELTPEEVDDVMSWIVEFRLIDDAQYVERFLSAAFERKPLSRLMARRTLQKKGIPDALLLPALERWYSLEATEDVAYRAAVKKLRMIGTATPSEKESKLIRFLQYRAYPWSTVKQVVERCKVEGILTCLVVVLCCSLSAVAQPDTCGRVRLPDAINQFQPTTIPVLDATGMLYVDRKQHPENRDGGVRDPDDVWRAYRTGTNLYTELSHTPIAEGVQPDVVFWVSADGLDALVVGPYCSQSTRSVRCLAVLHRSSPRGPFGDPTPISIPGVLDLGRNFYACMSEDRSTLILALDRIDGTGGLDLYVSQSCKGTWSAPRNLGTTINTPAFDGAPWIGPDGTTLYFASSGRDDRLGKADLYVTRRRDTTWASWTQPRNLGLCVNTIEDETAISLLPSFDSVMIHSWDAESGRTGIYIAPLAADLRPAPVLTLRGTVVDAVTRRIIPHAEIVLTSPYNCTSWTLQSDTINSVFSTVIPQRTALHLSTSANGYTTTTNDVRTQTLDSSSTMTLTVALFDTTRPLASLYFERGSAELTPASSDSLRMIIERLRQRSLSLVVRGYTDPIGSPGSNADLSRRRARAVADYMATHGIDSASIVEEGRGVEHSTAKHTSVERPESRRVDVFPRSMLVRDKSH